MQDTFDTAESLKCWRALAGFSRAQAARYIGLSAMQYGRLENGTAVVDRRTQRIILQWYALDGLMRRNNA